MPIFYFLPMAPSVFLRLEHSGAILKFGDNYPSRCRVIIEQTYTETGTRTADSGIKEEKED